MYRRLGGPQGQSGLVRKISLPPRFDPSTIQLVGRCSTSCAVMKLSVVIIEAWHSLINYIQHFIRHSFVKVREQGA